MSFASRPTLGAPAVQTDLNTAQDKPLTSQPEDSVSCLAFSPQADFLSVGSWDKKVRIYEVSAQGDSQGRALYEHQAPVLCSVWTQDGTKVMSGGCDNALRAFDVQSQQAVQIGQHDGPVSCLASVQVNNGTQNLIVSGSWDKTLKYWDIRQSQPVSTLQLPERAYSMSTAKQLLVVGTAERNLAIVDLNNPGTIFRSLQSNLKCQTRVVSCYPQGDGYAIGSIEGRCSIQYIDPNAASRQFSFKCHRQKAESARAGSETMDVFPVNAIAFHPVFGTFCTAGSDGSLHIWDKESKHRIKQSGLLGGSVSAATFNASGSLLAYAISYDWHKGYQYNTPSYPISVRIHPVIESDVKPRQPPKK